MNEPKTEFEKLQNTHRVALNLAVLLDIGTFPGKHAFGLHECKEMIKALVEELAQKLQPQVIPPPAPAIVPAPAPESAPPAPAAA
jgi:hypothetical protein